MYKVNRDNNNYKDSSCIAQNQEHSERLHETLKTSKAKMTISWEMVEEKGGSSPGV